MNKLKIVVGFMIIVTRIPETYGVTVPKCSRSRRLQDRVQPVA